MLKSLKYLVNPAGGLYYHLTAIKYKKKLWQNYIAEVNQWLSNWPIKHQKVLLIGPSAGYSLSPLFLKKFKQIKVIEPDPLAQYLFQKRFKQYDIEFDSHNYFYYDVKLNTFPGLRRLSAQNNDRAILFCNFLGQWPLLFKGQYPQLTQLTFNEILRRFKLELNEQLQYHNWATYHDKYSASAQLAASYEAALNAWSNNTETTKDNEYLRKLLQSLKDRPISITDHLTDGLRDGYSSKKIMAWQKDPQHIHFIEAKY